MIALSLLLTSLALAKGTDIAGGGGHGAVAEFRRIGEDSLRLLANRGDVTERTSRFEPARAGEQFAKAKVEATKEDLRLNGVDVTAINYPAENRIVFEEGAWAELDRQGKIQLVLHEVIGLTHRGSVSDGDYRVSKVLTELTLRSGVESVALALAQANFYQAERPRVQTKRTKIAGKFRDSVGEEGVITEVYVQTFENGSAEAVRVYRVYEDVTGAVVKAELVRSEGPVGP